MPTQDRTIEFRTCVESIRNRTALAKPRTPKPGSTKSEFARMAGAIGRDIAGCSVKLEKLAQCECLFIYWRGVQIIRLGRGELAGGLRRRVGATSRAVRS